MNHEPPTVSLTWHIVRLRLEAKYRAVLLSGEWIRLTTHFAKTTFLCSETEDCGGCAVGPARPYWYLPVSNIPHGSRAILELSATASADLEQRARFTARSVTAGLEIEISRRTKTSPVRCEVLGQAASPPLARLHEWASGLFHIFGLPMFRPEDTLQTYGERNRQLIVNRSNLASAEMRARSVAGIVGRL
jgi:hypothetical protein